VAQEQAYLDYYRAAGIIPTRLSVDETLFFAQRDHLFTSLGVPPSSLSGRDVLEVGSGTGQKSRHVLARGPRSFTAVDMNPASLAATRESVAPWREQCPVKLVECDITHGDLPVEADVVIAECVIPLQRMPIEVLRRCARAVRPGGTLILTTADSISTMSELIRRSLARWCGLIGTDPIASAEAVAAFFAEDLSHLPGMSRLPVDWALDQIVHPWVGDLLGMDEVIEGLPEFAPIGSSPRLAGDYGWYKDCTAFPDAIRTHWTGMYWANAHNLLDRRTAPFPRSASRNRELRQLCDSVLARERKAEAVGYGSGDLGDVARALIMNLDSTGPTTDSLHALTTVTEGTVSAGAAAGLASLRPWWGYGTQYIALTRINAAAHA